jgi:hypothetical protein
VRCGRTNLAQSTIAFKALELQLATADAGVHAADLWSSRLNGMWANNGDALSLIYAGTGALRSGFTRTGKRTVAGIFDDAVKSVNRMYVNTFLDDARQSTIDVLVGKLHRWQARTVLLRHPLQDDAEAALRAASVLGTRGGQRVCLTAACASEGQWESKRTLFLHLGTWNVNGRHPSSEPLTPWLTFSQGRLCPKLGSVPGRGWLTWRALEETRRTSTRSPSRSWCR